MSLLPPVNVVDAKAFRQALGQFATGITIVTAMRSDGEPIGLTVNSFNSVSLTPPLVLWSLTRTSSKLPIFEQAHHFAVNVLSVDQRALSQRFASSNEHRFEGVSFREGLGQAPLIEGCLAWFECRIRSRYLEGDHIIIVGEVERHQMSNTQDDPLVWYGGQYRSLNET